MMWIDVGKLQVKARGGGGIAPLILNLGITGEGEWLSSHVGLFTSGLRYPVNRSLGGPQSRSGRFGEEKNLLPVRGIEPRSLGRPALSLCRRAFEIFRCMNRFQICLNSCAPQCSTNFAPDASAPQCSTNFAPDACPLTLNFTFQIAFVFRLPFQLMVPAPYMYYFYRKFSVSTIFSLYILYSSTPTYVSAFTRPSSGGSQTTFTSHPMFMSAVTFSPVSLSYILQLFTMYVFKIYKKHRI